MKKKLVSLMLVAAMTASLTACGSKKTEEPTSTVHKSITAAEYDAAITSDAAIYKKAFTMPEYKGIQVTVDKSVLNVAESDVDDYINKNIFYLQLLGSVMLLLFGIYTFRSNPVQSIRPASSSKGSYFHNFITAFFVTLSNPLIIFLFIGLFARFAFVQQGVLVFEEITGYFAIAAGALTWWLGITYFVNKVRTKFNLRGIWILNRVIGSIVMLVSVAGLIYTLLGESIY